MGEHVKVVLGEITMRTTGFFLTLGLFAVVACSNAPPTPDAGGDAGATCDDTKCKPGNKCISDGKTLTCRIPCTTNDPSECPFNFTCVGASAPNTNKAGETLNYCVKNTYLPMEKPAGQWGTACNPAKGFDMNPDCDNAQNFFCYGNSPTDPDSFCTYYDCNSDSDCKGGWWCASINTTPNVATGNRTFGPDQVRNVCLPRAYNLHFTTRPSPCKTDVDCPLNQGAKQHCVDPGDGVHLMCAVECKLPKNCPNDQTCGDVGLVDSGGNPQLVCVPRSGTFGPLGAMEKGKGDFCTPCHADDDCIDGVCALAEKSTEHFCTKASKVPCVVQNNMLTSDCPMAMNGEAAAGVSCTYNSNTADLAPKNQCFGLVFFGAGVKVPGCWTAAR